MSQSEPGSNDNEGVLRITQSPSITGTSPSDCLVLYPGHSLGKSYPSAEMQSVYPTAQADSVERQGLRIFDLLYPLVAAAAIMYVLR